MYELALVLGFIIGGHFIWRGILLRRRSLIVVGALIALVVPGLLTLMSFWGEALWFAEVGYLSRFWRLILTRVLLACVGAAIGAFLIFILTRNRLTSLVGACFGVLWWFTAWNTTLLFWYSEATGQRDPIFGRDISFHLFGLPFYETVVWFLIAETLIAISSYASYGVGLLHIDALNSESASQRTPTIHWQSLSLAFGVLAVLIAVRVALQPYHLLLSNFGVTYGAGWTDVWIRRPAYYIQAAATALVAIILLVPSFRKFFDQAISRLTKTSGLPVTAMAGAGSFVILWIIGLWMVPSLFQWLKVSPNEITVERPYINHNIEFTRKAFGLNQIEDREFPVSDLLTQNTLDQNQHILSEVRLWDPRALAAVYKQFQEIRLYYEMDQVDIDRYHLGGQYRQVMVAAREMLPNSLPAESQTFVNQRFKYTHGYGLTMSPVSKFRMEGLPEMFLKNIPPQATFPSLKMDRPEIYYGERTYEHVIANSHEKEFDYPSGEKNVYAHYEGKGGVPISSFWRRLVFGWKFDGTKFVVSSYLRPESRILFHRHVKDRVQTLAPFLSFDEDPYIVVSKGRLCWIVDGYTTSGRYPYSEPFLPGETITLPEGKQAEQGLSIQPPVSLSGANYISNSVKAVVDAYDGSVDFYIFSPDDPVITSWSKAFPDLFKPRSSMPSDLEKHVRYPEGLLLAQSLVYSKYHMTDPEVFYNQEDLWVRATEKYYEQVQPVDPYYVMWQPPGTQRPEFILMQPFTPKNRQVLIGWIAGMCDPPNYGRLLAYHFPKEKRVLGTQQVDTKIDQDPELSAQLTLWNQEGKKVIRGNVLAIPISETLLYVEPIYIQADVAAYPELRLVVVMHNDHMSAAPTFDQALAGLLKRPDDKMLAPKQLAGEAAATKAWNRAAQEFNYYLKNTAEGNFSKAGEHLSRLQEILEEQTR